MVLELDNVEQMALKHALEALENELKTERVKTDSREVRAAIRDEEAVIDKLLRKVA